MSLGSSFGVFCISWAFSLLFYFPTLDNIQGKSFHDSCNQSNLQVIIELINEGLAYCKNLNCIKMLLIVPQALCHLWDFQVEHLTFKQPCIIFVYYMNIWLTRRSQLYSCFKKRMHCHSLMVLIKIEQVMCQQLIGDFKHT